MLKRGLLHKAFQTYWKDMERCRGAKAYWCLLHVTVCLPDICAALQSTDGESKGNRYIVWCDQWLAHAALSGVERWAMRCKVLHQGRASTGMHKRYTAFAFGQPHDTGTVDHMRVDSTTLHLDVGALAAETQQAVARWIEWLEANPSSSEARNVEKHLPSLVRVNRAVVMTPASSGGVTLISIVGKTN